MAILEDMILHFIRIQIYYHELVIVNIIADRYYCRVINIFLHFVQICAKRKTVHF